ncbi:MAG: pyruvate kinase [Bacilli bacterium]|nr:pyruvate kinase [Bacilli bacterium]
MKKTKIICSIGPATQSWEKFKGIVDAGMNVARINFSHATLEERKQDEDLVKRANDELGTNIAILYDTKGPDLRTCTFDGDYIELVEGSTIRIVEEDLKDKGNKEKISFNYRNIVKDLKVGMSVLLDDGFYKLVVEDVEDDGASVVCRIINGGTIKSRRGVCIPGIKLDIPFVSEDDKKDIQYACEHDGDYLALSFVNSADDVQEVKKLCAQFGKPNMKIISKVETQYAIDNLKEIVGMSDYIMIARGDLGIETGVENLPLYQQMMIDECHLQGKGVIMATQMMSSMKHNIRPTNAEVTDVANAVLQGCDAIMTSDETTMGEYPVETIQKMNEICESVESYCRFENDSFVNTAKDITSIIAESVVTASNDIEAKVIVAATMSGHTARKISNLRPVAPILATVPNEKVAHELALNYGVYPVLVKEYNSTDEVVNDGKEKAVSFANLNKGDHVIITGGFPNTGNKITNFMKIEEI